MEDERTSVLNLLKQINSQLQSLQIEVNDVKRDLRRLQQRRNTSCSNGSEENSGDGEGKLRHTLVRLHSLGQTLDINTLYKAKLNTLSGIRNLFI